MFIKIKRFLFYSVCCPNSKALTMLDRKSTRLNSSHANISYAVFCLKKKNADYDVIGQAYEALTYLPVLVTYDGFPSLRRHLELSALTRLEGHTSDSSPSAYIFMRLV